MSWCSPAAGGGVSRQRRSSRRRHEVLGEGDLAEVGAVVVAHRGSTSRVAAIASRATSVASRFQAFSLGAS